jgi:hypothetical protein
MKKSIFKKTTSLGIIASATLIGICFAPVIASSTAAQSYLQKPVTVSYLA